MRTRTFQMLSVFATSLISLSFLSGCSTELPGNGVPVTPINQPDGGQTDVQTIGGDGTSDGTSEGWENVKVDLSVQGYTVFRAKTPDDKPASFYVCGYSCTGGSDHPETVPVKPMFSSTDITNIEAKMSAYDQSDGGDTKGQRFSIRVIRSNYLFADREFTAIGSKDKTKATLYSHEWKEVGSWGLAPNKTGCIDSHDGKKKNVVTSVKNGKVTLKIGDSYELWVTGDKFIETDSMPIAGMKYNGTIQPDLSVITYHITIGSLIQDGTLTCQ